MASQSLSRVEVPLTQGLVAFVDESDADRVLGYKWHAVIQSPTLRYAARSIVHGKSRRRVYLHRFVLDAGHGRDLVVDHINHDGLDNRRANLRLVSQSENIRNARFWTAPDQHKGVYQVNGTWQARIHHDGRQTYLGAFGSRAEACAAYSAAHLVLFGRAYDGRGAK